MTRRRGGSGRCGPEWIGDSDAITASESRACPRMDRWLGCHHSFWVPTRRPARGRRSGPTANRDGHFKFKLADAFHYGLYANVRWPPRRPGHWPGHRGGNCNRCQEFSVRVARDSDAIRRPGLFQIEYVTQAQNPTRALALSASSQCQSFSPGLQVTVFIEQSQCQWSGMTSVSVLLFIAR